MTTAGALEGGRDSVPPAPALGRLGAPVKTRRRRLARAAEQLLLGAAPLLITGLLAAYQFKIHAVALDFHVAYYPAAKRILDGLSPYAVSRAAVLAGDGYVYPPLSALLLSPLALIGVGVAQVIYMLACIACVPAALAVLRVGDWRVYGLALLWLPVFVGWQGGNVTLVLVLLVALAWRHRDRPLVAAVLVAVAVSVKPFVWPLWLWLIATRRLRSAALALILGLVLNAACFALIGFGQVARMLAASALDAGALWRQGYAIPALAHHLGLARGAADALLLALAAVLAAAMLARGLRAPRASRAGLADATLEESGVAAGRDADTLVIALALMLVASPLVWVHYFALLLVGLGLRRPRLAPVWALPLAMWPLPPRQPVHGWEEALAWSVAAACVGASLVPRRRIA